MSQQQKNGMNISVQRYSERSIRIRLAPTKFGDLRESFMDRLQLIAGPNTDPNTSCTVTEVKSGYEYRWPDLVVKFDRATLSWQVQPAHGHVLTFSAAFELGCSKLNINLEEEEHFFGLGYRKIDFLELRGHVFRSRVAYGAAYGPQPFIYSSAGYGLYLNSTEDSYFDVGAKDANRFNVTSTESGLDIFIFLGDPRLILNEYTSLTGRPYLMPKTGYGLMFIGNEKEDQFDILNDAERFRQEEIPCQYIGLEPGWMAKKYDTSVDKEWNQERFYMPYWSDDRKQFQPETFIGALKRKKFGLSLWLCCDYDVMWAEQNRLHDHDYKIEQDIEFNEKDFDQRAHMPLYMDKITKRDEPWAQHLMKFVDDGASVFKQDPAFVSNDHPDRLYAQKYTDDEIHNIYVTILARQFSEAYKAHTGGLRPMYYTGTGFTGIQAYAPSWTCDCGGREEALMGVLLSGMCGHMNMTVDLEVTSLDGMHFGFLLPWSQINSWASMLQPWYLSPERFASFKFYARLHAQLLPYLYAAAKHGHDTGMPIVQALPLVYPDDPNSYQANREYLLGDSLLVGAFSHRLYLPEGDWYDYWTNQRYTGGQWLDVDWPKDRGGALFVKAGAVLPLQDLETDEIVCHLYPGVGTGVVYADDGVSFAYEKGEFAITTITSNYTDNGCHVTVKKTGVTTLQKQSLRFVTAVATVPLEVIEQED